MVIPMKGRDDGSPKLGELLGYHDWLQDDRVHDKMLLNCQLDSIDEDHILRRLREIIDSGGTETTKIEVRYENLSVERCMFVGHRAHPSLYNVTFNAIQHATIIWARYLKKKNVNTLRSITGIIKPSRMTLLLGPPGAGKTTLLLALAGKLDQDLNAQM
ncbi:plant PDR ABC transporter associated [Artemisia annua]|uniref:Plant PDR ABC transporter associated n=1 Tax=Artemisia annua TaxID=35608 RepID=A0A2U1MRH3_ARTAN|nr:plant PDR ABC transporter associated [Artemisia annua]